MSEDRASKIIQRGEEARRITESETFLAGLRAVEADALRAFKAATTPEESWNAHHAMMAAQNFATWIRIAVNQGEAEFHRIRQEEEQELAQKRETGLFYDVNEARKARKAIEETG